MEAGWFHRIFYLFVVVYVDRLLNGAENEINAGTDRGIDVNLHEGGTGFIEKGSRGSLQCFGQINCFQRRTTRKYVCAELGYTFGDLELCQRGAVTESIVT